MIHRLEKAILVGVELQNQSQIPLRESLAELARLADTAKALVVGRLSQKRPQPDQKYFIGKGKLAELQALAASRDANLVIFDAGLSGSQERNLENALGLKVIDRTELILDIFAQHARSREGKLQVELAQSEFLLTRLTGQGVHMSRLGGGIGTRGPGETKLEYDRRRIRKRIAELKREIEKVRKDRALRREKRKKSKLPTVALVGYTNSGKSTLLNALTRAAVLAEDKLFATLDTTVRRLRLASDQTVLLSDTVGFLQRLPHQLVAAFRATLEEITEADLLLHVVDLSHPNFSDQISAVYTVLEELKAATKPIITIFNKIDRLNKKPPKKLFSEYQPAAAVSALQEKGLEEVKELLAKSAALQPAPPAGVPS